MRSGRKMISPKRALSRTSLCILRSRPSLPLLPLEASTTTSPLAVPFEGSNCRLPVFSAKVPCTACSVLPSVHSTALCVGSTAKIRAPAGACRAASCGRAMTPASAATTLAHSSLTVHLSFATDSFCRLKGLRGNKPPPPAHSHLNQKRGRSFSYVRSQHAFETNPDRSPSRAGRGFFAGRRDRKSTRLNSSHGYISYAVFCLKKKKKQ